MEAAFEHIEQALYLLTQIFEVGFSSARNMTDQLEETAKAASEIGLTGGAALLRTIAIEITQIAAGELSMGSAASSFCNALSYYRIIADALVLETMSKNPGDAEGPNL